MDDRHDVGGLLRQLTGEGMLDSAGRFSLDPKKARDKARNLRFLDDGQYLRCFYRGAVLGEASEVDVYVDSDDTIFRFDGPALTDSQLRYLAASLYVDDESYCGRKLQQLAMGLHGCWAQGYFYAEIRSPLAAYRYLPESAEPTQIASRTETVNEIRLKRRFGTKVLKRFLSGEFPEEQVFVKGMGWSAVTTLFNGREMARNRCDQGEFRLDTSLPKAMHLRASWNKPRKLNLPDLDLELSLIMDLGKPRLPGRFQLIVADVDAGEYFLPYCPGMDATVSMGPLRLDASQQRAVEGEEFHRLLDYLRAAWVAAGLEGQQVDPIRLWSCLTKRDLPCGDFLRERFWKMTMVPLLGGPQPEVSLDDLRQPGLRLLVGMPADRPRDARMVHSDSVPLLERVGLPFERVTNVLRRGPLNKEEHRKSARPVDFSRLDRRNQTFVVPLLDWGDEVCFDTARRVINCGGTIAPWQFIHEVTAEETWDGTTLYLVVIGGGRDLSFRQNVSDPHIRQRALHMVEQLLARLDIPHRRSWWI